MNSSGDYDDRSSQKFLFSMNRGTWNEDVLTEILLRLPAKSLTRFKLVCKHWLSLISTHRFSHLHTLRHHKPEPSLILYARTSRFFYLHPLHSGGRFVPYHFNLPSPKILSSCNGLLLLQCEHPHKEYYVYNPTTKQSRKISLTNSNKYRHVLGLNLAFDPSKSPHYKIVCVRAAGRPYYDNPRRCQVEVYDSASHAWKLCLEHFSAPLQVKFSSGAHWNSVIHWENHPRAHLYFDIDKNVMGNLPYAKIPWPEGGGGTACHCQLQESNGYFHHFAIVSNRGDKSVAIYELQGDYSEWLLKYHDGIGRVPGASRILSFIRGDGNGTSTLVFHVPGKITAYGLPDKSFEELIDLTNQPFYQENAVQFDSEDVYPFGETLAPV